MLGQLAPRPNVEAPLGRRHVHRVGAVHVRGVQTGGHAHVHEHHGEHHVVAEREQPREMQRLQRAVLDGVGRVDGHDRLDGGALAAVRAQGEDRIRAFEELGAEATSGLAIAWEAAWVARKQRKLAVNRRVVEGYRRHHVSKAGGAEALLNLAEEAIDIARCVREIR